MGFAPSKKAFRVLLCLLVVMLGVFVFINMNQLTPTSLVNIVPMFILMLLTPFGMRNFNQKKMLRNQLNEANEQIKDLVKREERQRIARDLHDTLRAYAITHYFKKSARGEVNCKKSRARKCGSEGDYTNIANCFKTAKGVNF